METELALLNIGRLDKRLFGVLINSTCRDVEQFLDGHKNNPDFDLTPFGPVANYLSQLQPLLAKYDLVLDRSRASQWTDKLAEADLDRDRAFAALRTAVRLYRNSDRDDERQAANTLQLVMDHHRGFEQQNYVSKSALIDTLIGQLTGEQFGPAVAFLHLERYVERLQRSADSFGAAMNGLMAERSQALPYTTVSLRGPMSALYRNMCQYVRAITVAGVPEAGLLLRRINMVRAECAENLARHLTALAKRKAKSELVTDSEAQPVAEPGAE